MASPEDQALFHAGVETHMNEILAVLALGGPLPAEEGQVQDMVQTARQAMASRQLLEMTVGQELSETMHAEAISRLIFLGPDGVDRGGEGEH